jgi:hypothetical protein
MSKLRLSTDAAEYTHDMDKLLYALYELPFNYCKRSEYNKITEKSGLAGIRLENAIGSASSHGPDSGYYHYIRTGEQSPDSEIPYDANDLGIQLSPAGRNRVIHLEMIRMDTRTNVARFWTSVALMIVAIIVGTIQIFSPAHIIVEKVLVDSPYHL